MRTTLPASHHGLVQISRVQPCFRRSARIHLATLNASNVAEPTLHERDSPQNQTPLPTSYRRLIARRTGDSFGAVAEIEELTMPEPKEGEVLIQVAYAGINGGCETFRCRGEHAFAVNRKLPFFALGAEGAGTVVRVGPGVTGLQPGQHVTFIGGAFSEYFVGKAALCWPVEAATPEAVALTISGTVANAALKYVGNMQPGETVLVTAAGGATGSFAVQLAKAAGCHVVATCGNDKKAEKLNALGLDRVINYKTESIEEVLKCEYNGKIDVAYEGVGGMLQAAAWDALRVPGGRLLAVGYISEYPHVTENVRVAQELGQQRDGALPPSAELFWGGWTVESPDGKMAYGKVWPADRADTLKAKKEVFDMHQHGKLQAWVDTGAEFIGLEQVPVAVEHMLTGQAEGKVVVRIGNDVYKG